MVVADHAPSQRAVPWVVHSLECSPKEAVFLLAQPRLIPSFLS